MPFSSHLSYTAQISSEDLSDVSVESFSKNVYLPSYEIYNFVLFFIQLIFDL